MRLRVKTNVFLYRLQTKHLRLCAHAVTFPSVSKMSFPILSVCPHGNVFTRCKIANVCLDKNSISSGLLSPFIFHQMKSLLVNEFLKTSSAHYNKVNSFIMYVQHHRYEVCRFFESKTHFKSFINHYILERLYILFYSLLKFLT